MIGVAFLREEHAAEGVPAGEEGGEGGGNSHFKEEVKENVANDIGIIHAAEASAFTLTFPGLAVKSVTMIPFGLNTLEIPTPRQFTVTRRARQL